MHPPGGVRGDPQIQEAAVADRLLVDFDQMRDAAQAGIFRLVIEPARPQRHIALRRNAEAPVHVTAAEIRLVDAAGGRFPRGARRGPGRDAAAALRRRVAALVADPAKVGADVAEDRGLRLKFPDQSPVFRPAVVGAAVDAPFFARAAVPAVAAVGPVEPHFKGRAVIAQHLAELFAEHFGHILRFAVTSVVPVPRRHVEADLQPGAAAGGGHLPD